MTGHQQHKANHFDMGLMLQSVPGTSSVSGSFMIPMDHLLGLAFTSSIPSDDASDGGGGCGSANSVSLNNFHHLAEAFGSLCFSGSLMG